MIFSLIVLIFLLAMSFLAVFLPTLEVYRARSYRYHDVVDVILTGILFGLFGVMLVLIPMCIAFILCPTLLVLTIMTLGGIMGFIEAKRWIKEESDGR